MESERYTEMKFAAMSLNRAIESLEYYLGQIFEDTIVKGTEIEILLTETKRLNSFLTAAMNGRGRNSEEIPKGDLDSVRKVASDVEDFADELFCKTMRKQSGENYWLSYLVDLQTRFAVARQILSLTARIRDVNVMLKGYVKRDSVLGESWEETEFLEKIDAWMAVKESPSPLVDKFLVGMEDEVNKLSSLLINEEKEGCNVRVVSVVGMGGIGKTTIAKKVYGDRRVRDHFERFAWANVGSDLKPRKVMETLLQQLCVVGGREELLPSSDLDLAKMLFKSQVSDKCLIVLDDVWEDTWKCLQIAFPLQQTGSRVLLTTRCIETTKLIPVDKRVIQQMRCLNQEEGYQLLQKTVLFRPDYLHLDKKIDQDTLVEVGKSIAKKCLGLPLAIKVVGGLLRERTNIYDWKEVLQKLDTETVDHIEDVYSSKSKDFEEARIIASSLLLAYNSLPYQLKQCFLYIGMFPEDTEVGIEKLYLQWSAEGLVPYRGKGSKVTKMDIAEAYLYELAVRSLVLVQEEDFPNSRRFRSCHLHDLVRELCLFKQKEENFSDVVYFTRANNLATRSLSPSSTIERHRLSFYFEDGSVVPIGWNADRSPWSTSLKNIWEYWSKFESPAELSSLRDLTNLRLLCLRGFNFEVLRLPPVGGKLMPLQFLSLRNLPLALSDFNNYRRLRVLSISGFNFDVTKLPGGIEKLSYLRYVSFSSCKIARLPPSMASLFNLETLLLQDCPDMIIPNMLQNLRRLRHLCLPRSFKVLGGDKLRVDALKDLLTLVNFDSRVCEVKDIFKLTKLHQLTATVDGNVEDLETVIHFITMNSQILQSSLLVRNLDLHPGTENFVTSHLFECPNLHSLHVEGHLWKLPQNISQSLTKLSFIGSKLEEDPLQKLEKLPNLLSLGLRNNAYLGNQMTCSSTGMPRLKYLTLSCLLNMETLIVEEGGMPKLSTFAIENCPKMKLSKAYGSQCGFPRPVFTWTAPSFYNQIHN